MIRYNVKEIRAAGLDCRWTKTRTGAPIIAAERHGRWFVIDKKMWERAEAVGILEAFNEHTLLGDIFHVSV